MSKSLTEALSVADASASVCSLTGSTIAFDHASADARWRDHHTPKTYGLLISLHSEDSNHRLNLTQVLGLAGQA